MTDVFEQELESVLAEHAFTMPDTIAVPADLAGRVRGRRRADAMRRAIALAAMLVLIAGVGVALRAPGRSSVQGAGGGDPLPRGTTLLTTDDHTRLLAVDDSGKVLGKFSRLDPHGDGLDNLWLAPDHRTLQYTLLTDGRCSSALYKRDLATGQQTKEADTGGPLNPAGTMFADGGCQGDPANGNEFVVHDVRTGIETRIPVLHGIVSAVAWAPDGTRLVVEVADRKKTASCGLEEVTLAPDLRDAARQRMIKNIGSLRCSFLSAGARHIYLISMTDTGGSTPQRFFLDVYDASYRHVGHAADFRTMIGPIVEQGDAAYMAGIDNGADANLVRIGSDYSTTDVRHNIWNVVAVLPR